MQSPLLPGLPRGMDMSVGLGGPLGEGDPLRPFGVRKPDEVVEPLWPASPRQAREVIWY